MSTGAAIAVAVSVASDVRGCVDERGYLELMPVPIRDIRECLGKVDVFAAADIDSRGGLPFSGIICFILYLMKKGKFGAN